MNGKRHNKQGGCNGYGTLSMRAKRCRIEDAADVTTRTEARSKPAVLRLGKGLGPVTLPSIIGQQAEKSVQQCSATNVPDHCAPLVQLHVQVFVAWPVQR